MAAFDEFPEFLNARVTTIHCRSGIVGDLCMCWRCRGLKGPSADETSAARDAQLVDAARRTWPGLTGGKGTL